MRIEKEVLNELDAMGIRVRCYVCSDEEMRDSIFNESYRRNLFGYYHTEDGNEADYTEEQKAIARKEAQEYVDRKLNWMMHWGGLWYDSTEFYITYGEDRMIKRTCSKGELITKDRVLQLIERDKKAYQGAYGEFTDKMRKLLKADGKLGYFNIYPTTYGIGVFVFYNYHLKDDTDYLDKKLKELGLEYYNEFSEARWVFRYKISKKQANLAKIV